MQYLRAKTLNFNSRPSARGDFPRLPCLTLPFHFNSRPSARGDGSHQRPHQPPEISIHAPPRGATEQPFLDFDFCRFQFTPLREGRPATGRVCLGTNGISIHAPPRGATGYPSQLWCRGLLSIHAPPRGATPAPRQGKRPAPYFNSRPSARGDLSAAATHCVAPFQFTPLREGRPCAASSPAKPINFNSRPSARGDPAPRQGKRPAPYFNSRPSARGDPSGVSFSCLLWLSISIHAPPRGATKHRSASLSATSFQFTPLREGRPAVSRVVSLPFVFQFTPLREGRRRAAGAVGSPPAISIHAPPRGAT